MKVFRIIHQSYARRFLRYWVTVIILLLSKFGFTQAFNAIEWYNADSLLEVLSNQTGHEKVNTLNRLASTLSFEDVKQSSTYAWHALRLAEDMDYKFGILAAKRNFGHIAFYSGDYPAALMHYHEAYDKVSTLNDLRYKALLVKDIAITHFYANNFDKVEEIIQEGWKIYRQKNPDGSTVGTVKDTLVLNSNIGLFYRTTGRSQLALKFYLDYIRIAPQHGFEITDVMLHHGLVAACYKEVGKPDSALFYYRKALEFPDANMSLQALKHEYKRRMAEIYIFMGQSDIAIEYLHQSYNWLSKQGFLRQSQVAALQLARLYLEAGRHIDALQFYNESEKLTSEMIAKRSFYRYDSMKYIVSYGTELYYPFSQKFVNESIYKLSAPLYYDLHRWYLQANNPYKAIDYFMLYNNSQDTLRRISFNREIVEIQTRYESVRKEENIRFLMKENELQEFRLKQSRTMFYIVVGLIAVALLMIIFIINQKRLKNFQQNLLLQQKLFRSQMNPHFIFNSLGSIQSSIINEEPDKAVRYLSRFSKLMRNILDSSADESVTLLEELNTIENYLELQRVRFPDKFDYSIEIDPRIDPESIFIPPMLAQPFIENAIEHGIKHKKTKGHIIIRFERKGSILFFEVEDDGVGRQMARKILMEQDKDHKSLATAITLERINVLNKKLKKKITLEIIDLGIEQGEPKGTRVVFGIPIN